MNKKEICKNFVKGKCIHGDKCYFSHDIPQEMIKIPQTCKYFLSNSCYNKKSECHHFHGFGGCLFHYKTIKANSGYINNLVKMDDTKFISSDEKSFIVLFLKDDKKSETSLDKKGIKIGKMIYSSDKVIFALQREGK